MTVASETSEEVELQGTREGTAWDDVGPSGQNVRAGLQKQLQQDLEKQAEKRTSDLQSQVTARLEKLKRYRDLGTKQAAEILSNPNYFGAMMVQYGQVDGLVTGARETASWSRALASKECGSWAGSSISDVTSTCDPAMARTPTAGTLTGEATLRTAPTASPEPPPAPLAEVVPFPVPSAPARRAKPQDLDSTWISHPVRMAPGSGRLASSAVSREAAAQTSTTTTPASVWSARRSAAGTTDGCCSRSG